MRSLALAVVLVTASLLEERPARACSCGGPDASLLSPKGGTAAPTSSRVRLIVPATGRPLPFLRVHGGAKVATTAKSSPLGEGDNAAFLVELAPMRPLQAGTRYEIALETPGEYPPTTVFGTFKTGSSADTTAPRIDSLGKATPERSSELLGSTCDLGVPWIAFEGLKASDPGREGADLVIAAWIGDAQGKVDLRGPPASVTRAREGKFTLGRTSLCDALGAPLPRSPVVTVALAVLDESGNRSAPQTVRVDMSAGTP